jgi:hypothetical protein
MRLTAKDGRTVSLSASFPHSNPENPVSIEVLEDKFCSLIVPRYSRTVADKAIEAVLLSTVTIWSRHSTR